MKVSTSPTRTSCLSSREWLIQGGTTARHSELPTNGFLNESFGIGVIVERTFGDGDFTVVAVPFGYRIDRWKFYVAPGIEDSDEHGTQSLVRLGAEYAFKAGSWEISPQFAVDFVGGHKVLVLGVVFGKGF